MNEKSDLPQKKILVELGPEDFSTSEKIKDSGDSLGQTWAEIMDRVASELPSTEARALFFASVLNGPLGCVLKHMGEADTIGMLYGYKCAIEDPIKYGGDQGVKH